MKKICTITCHDVYNAGASLQSYALMKHLLNLGFEVEIIDYKPDYLSRHYYLWGIQPKYSKNIILMILYYLVKLPGRLIRLLSKRKIRYDRFKKHHLICTKTKYHSVEELRNDPPLADCYIAGSDQIWNPILENGRDPAFYLDFVPCGKKKISYAGSFSVKELPSDLKQTVKNYLKAFDAISVRETSALPILQDLDVDGIAVLDPVFLLDKSDWCELCPSLTSNPYVLVYDFDKNQSIKELAITMAKAHGYKIYSVLDCDWADKCFSQYGPDMFVSLIKNASFVISNSFHASAFSIIFNIPFCVFHRQWGINSRMIDLLTSVGLEKQIVNGTNQELTNIDWDKVNHKLEELKNISTAFIIKNIGECHD